MLKVVLILIGVLGTNLLAGALNTNSFPENFLFGVGSSAYQIEGAWNESGKTETIWDYLVHNQPNLVFDGSNGDIACDSYNHIDEDVEIIKNLGVNFYFFSISWARLLPNAQSSVVSAGGLRYYEDLIDALVFNGITPMVSLLSWDLPNQWQKIGGFTNPTIINHFADYADVAFNHFGDRVKYWVTFNKPAELCQAYGEGEGAPVNLKLPGIGEYLCADIVLRAHAKAYHLYNEKYRETQNGQIGISLSMKWYQPSTANDMEDYRATYRGIQFHTGLFAFPIFSRAGGFPEEVRTQVDRRSTQEGFVNSRLPVLTDEEIEYIKGTYDFFGLSHFESILGSNRENDAVGTPSFAADVNILTSYDPSWESTASDKIKVFPTGLLSSLAYINNRLNDTPIIITENGYPDLGELDDDKRVDYFQQYLSAVLDARDRGINVIGYAAYNLMDSFEWLDGYALKYGLYSVNYSDPSLPRTIKKSGEYYKQLIQSRRLVIEEEEGEEEAVEEVVEE